jgi:hypothetical protein
MHQPRVYVQLSRSTGIRAGWEASQSPYIISISGVKFKIRLFELDIKYGSGSLPAVAQIPVLLLIASLFYRLFRKVYALSN